MFYGKLLYLLHTHTHTHTHTHIYIYIYLFINIKNSGKPKTVHQYWPVSEIYRTAGQTGTVSGTVLTPLIYRDVILNWFLIKEPKKKKKICSYYYSILHPKYWNLRLLTH